MCSVIPVNNPFLLNMDFNDVAVVLADEQAWITSPADGVSRIHLEREAEESGHTTSFVRFAPGASFPEHTHPQGEELYILDGVFSDEYGDYPAGTYIRNPPGSRHKPFTREGCELFVKLEQFQAADTEQVVIRPEDQQWRPGIGNLRVLPRIVLRVRTRHWFSGQRMKCFSRIRTGAVRKSSCLKAVLLMNTASTLRSAGCAVRT